MTDTGPRKSVQPSISAVAFECPHCGAYTTQTWFNIYASRISGEHPTPLRPGPEIADAILNDEDVPQERKDSILEYFASLESGRVFFDRSARSRNADCDVCNLYLTRCFACKEFAVWVADRLIYPPVSHAPLANEDLPAEVRTDYDEASRIVNLSPRGAAALLRLTIQKLCKALGEKGKNIDDDIAELVKKGLSPMVRKALDSVRVIGNEAVHPGQVDLKDDTDTATKLFKLVNIIAEQMISNPKHVDDVYGIVPEAKRQAIEKRDGKA